ncbi:hypothetical protein SAPIO_CDS10247 [Scedosporium apiospermum]|uniref:Uncharacterized protein n=1 Tax=Pseudallescheria apiosperma TaxID=563466 RepID=A0A084FV04_PSEDA|nr:uncharacterized protein SAPIO_CDS10247 [Scedosporium apiospermum]KEZ38916.1 hypothetical protein SAPIO_CDS10247 [Scedosporium apiospermum]
MSNLPHQPDGPEDPSPSFPPGTVCIIALDRRPYPISPDTMLNHTTDLVRKSADGLRARGLRLEGDEDIRAVGNILFAGYQQSSMPSTPPDTQVNDGPNANAAATVDSDPAPTAPVSGTARPQDRRNASVADPLGLKSRRANPDFKPEDWTEIFPRFAVLLIQQFNVGVWGEAAAMAAVVILYQDIPPEQWCSWGQWRTQFTNRELYFSKEGNNRDYIEWCIERGRFPLNPARACRYLGENNPGAIYGSTSEKILTDRFKRGDFDFLDNLSDVPVRRRGNNAPVNAHQADAANGPVEAEDSLFVSAGDGSDVVDTADPDQTATEVDADGNSPLGEDADLTFGGFVNSDLDSATNQNAPDVPHDINHPIPAAAPLEMANSFVTAEDVSLNGGNFTPTPELWAEDFDEGDFNLDSATGRIVTDLVQDASFIPELTPAGMGDSSFMTHNRPPFIQGQAAGGEVGYGTVSNVAANRNTGLDNDPFRNGPVTDFVASNMYPASGYSSMYDDYADALQTTGQFGQHDSTSNAEDHMMTDVPIDPAILEEYNRRVSEGNNQ